MNTPFPPLRKPKSLRISTHSTNNALLTDTGMIYLICRKGNTTYPILHALTVRRHVSSPVFTCRHLLLHHLGRLMPGAEKIGLMNQILWQINRQYDKGKEENQNAGIPFECRQRNKNSGIKLKNKVSQEIVKDDYPHNHGPS